jgi:hypothetical protein
MRSRALTDLSQVWGLESPSGASVRPPSPPLPERHPLNKIAALIDPIPTPC